MTSGINHQRKRHLPRKCLLRWWGRSKRYRMEEIQVEMERLRREAEERVVQMRQEVAENLGPTRSVKNEIIEKQDALIGLLYREEDASPEIRELKREVESKKAVLQKRRALFPKL